MELVGKKVIVVGGGTGGGAAALLLARAGAEVTVFEKVAETRAVGAGIALAANGLAVLGALLGPDTFAPLSCPVDEARIVDGRGRLVFRPRGAVPRVVMLRRSNLQACLADALRAAPRVIVRHGAELVQATRDGRCVVRTGAAEETHAANLIVGADGVHSAVRGAGDFGARVSRTGIAYLRGLAGPGLARGAEAWTSAGLFGSFAVPGGTYFFASASSAAAGRAVADRDLEAWRAVVVRAYPAAADVLAGVRSFDELLVNEVVRVDCRRLHDGCLVLLGDAAHAMAPNLGKVPTARSPTPRCWWTRSVGRTIPGRRSPPTIGGGALRSGGSRIGQRASAPSPRARTLSPVGFATVCSCPSPASWPARAPRGGCSKRRPTPSRPCAACSD